MDTAFLLRRVMNLERHGLADYSVRGWQHLPEVLRTGFFSASNVTIFRLQACRQASSFATHRERIEDKENWKVNQRPELFGMDLLGIVTPSMEVYASTFNDCGRWTCARLQSMGKCGLLRRLSLFRPTSCESRLD